LGETVYVRKVEKRGCKRVKVDIAATPNIKNPVQARDAQPSSQRSFFQTECAGTRSFLPLKGTGTRVAVVAFIRTVVSKVGRSQEAPGSRANNRDRRQRFRCDKAEGFGG
jgi:hypothetical protein